jgi:hypothetical protein
MAEELRAEVQELLDRCGEQQIPKELAECSSIIYTPSRVIKCLDVELREARIQHAAVLAALPPKERLAYQLRKAIESEKFELAANLKAEIEALPAGS